MASRIPKFRDALQVLMEHDVEYLVVGGVAANLWAAVVTTIDLDILYSQEPQNVDRLIAALGELNAVYRDPAGRRIEPRRELLVSGGHHRFLTTAGPLDVLATVGAGRSYQDLKARSEVVKIRSGGIRVLSLEALIETKEEAAREKDRDALPALRMALRLREDSSDPA